MSIQAELALVGPLVKNLSQLLRPPVPVAGCVCDFKEAFMAERLFTRHVIAQIPRGRRSSENQMGLRDE